MTLREYLKKHNITQREMAERVGITISHLRMLMSGGSSPSKKLAIKIESDTSGEVTKEEAIFHKENMEEIQNWGEA